MASSYGQGVLPSLHHHGNTTNPSTDIKGHSAIDRTVTELMDAIAHTEVEWEYESFKEP